MENELVCLAPPLMVTMVRRVANVVQCRNSSKVPFPAPFEFKINPSVLQVTRSILPRSFQKYEVLTFACPGGNFFIGFCSSSNQGIQSIFQRARWIRLSKWRVRSPRSIQLELPSLTNDSTTGGEGGTTTTVSSLSAFTAAAAGSGKAVIYVSGVISGGATVKVASDKSILGLNSQAALSGVGLTIKGVSNVIVRNLKISKVLAANGDAIGIQTSKNIWIDHMDLSSDQSHGKE